MPDFPQRARLRQSVLAVAAALPERLRARAVRVHCITNTVAQAYTANMLLAAGAIPSMTTAPDEIASFAASAQSLLVNLGTSDAERRAAIGLALDAVGDRLPWVLDPVLIDRSALRADFARALAGRGPAAIRMNAAEAAALALRGDAAAVVAVSGARDRVAQGERRLALGNGHRWMAQVTAMGCAASAYLAACLAVEPDRFLATAAALTVFGVAGEVAAEASHGPGSFAIAMIDALAALDSEIILRRARIEELADAP